jgi:hypothetical protein
MISDVIESAAMNDQQQQFARPSPQGESQLRKLRRPRKERH